MALCQEVARHVAVFLKLLDTTYPAHTAIQFILDNHSAHISKETRGWLAEQRAGCFEKDAEIGRMPARTGRSHRCTTP